MTHHLKKISNNNYSSNEKSDRIQVIILFSKRLWQKTNISDVLHIMICVRDHLLHSHIPYSRATQIS